MMCSAPVFIPQEAQIELIILAVKQDLLTPIGPRNDMVESSGKMYSRFFSHNLPLSMANLRFSIRNNLCLTPLRGSMCKASSVDNILLPLG